MKRHQLLWTTSAVSVLLLLVAACAEPVEQPEPADEAIEEQDDEPDPAEEASEEEAEDAEATEDDVEATEQDAPEPEQVTAYVVGYHWGWAVFDEDGTELEQLEVAVGSEVELIAVNDHASHAIEQLPDPVAETISAIDWHDRAHEDLEMGYIPDPAEQEGMGLGEALTVAHDGHDHLEPAQDHALMVAGIGVEAFLGDHADEPAHLEFTVDEEGAYEFRCTEECGPLHDHQRREMLVATG